MSVGLTRVLAGPSSTRRFLFAAGSAVLATIMMLPGSGTALPFSTAPALAAASFTVSPTSGPPGTTITVRGTGLRPDSNMEVSFACTDSLGGGVSTYLGYVKVGADGTATFSQVGPFAADLQVQNGTPACPFSVNVTAISAERTLAQFHQPFTITGSLPTATATTATQPTPTSTTVTLACAGMAPSFPGTLSAGQSATFVASGFRPGSAVNVTITGPSPATARTVAADGSCQVSVTLQVDVNDRPGSYTITATGVKPEGGPQSATASYTVPAPRTTGGASPGSSTTSPGNPSSNPSSGTSTNPPANPSGNAPASGNPSSPGGNPGGVDFGGGTASNGGSSPNPPPGAPPIPAGGLGGVVGVVPALGSSLPPDAASPTGDQAGQGNSADELAWIDDVRSGLDNVIGEGISGRGDYLDAIAACLARAVREGRSRAEAETQCLLGVPPFGDLRVASWATEIDSMVTFAGARLVRAMEEQEAQLAAGQRSVVTITPAVIFALTEQYRSCLNLLAVGGRSDLVRSSAEVTCLSVIEQYYVSP